MIKNAWGKRVIYQIYPRSFKDSNGDGVGDLKGITEKLGYLKNLGADAIWLSPIYKSPMSDFGYDISDYKDIDPIFGTIADFKNLLKKAHEKDIKILMDYVPNHTSVDHPWFKESKANKQNPKRDWYIWRQPKADGSRPNNWVSQFGGSAWELDAVTGEYYLHTFDVSQPDLNWRNPHVVKELLNVLRFWLKMGVDGFRVDVAYYLFKDPFFRDEPVNPVFNPRQQIQYNSLLHIYTHALPETLSMLKTFNSVINEYGDKFMVCEIYTFLHEIVNLYKIVDHHTFAPFNFSFISLPWRAPDQKKFIDEFDTLVGEDYYPTYVLGNHDHARTVTRLGEDAARNAALLQFTLRGIPFIYYGEELGMANIDVPKDRIKDPMAIRLKGFHPGRDAERSPMQWDETINAGFSKSDPWLPVGNDFKDINVASEQADERSFLNLYSSLLYLRKSRKSLAEGKYVPLNLNNPSILGFIRQKMDEKTLILTNFSNDKQMVYLPIGVWKTVLSTKMDIGERKEHNHVTLRPNEGLLLFD